MKNALLLDDFCSYYNIPEEAFEEVHRMTKDQLALLVFSLLKRVDELETQVSASKFSFQ